MQRNNITGVPKRNKNGSSKSTDLYHPSIFRYSCRGKLSLDSRTPTAGTCKGFQSTLEHIDHWRLTTREEAIRVFQQKSGDNEERFTNGNAVQQENATAAAHSLRMISNVLVYPSKESGDKRSKEEKSREDWSCYGSTEVDLLVLRPQHSKQESIAAVAPYSAPGVTIRDVAAPSLDGSDRTSTIRLGIVEIVYQSSITDSYDQEEEQEVQYEAGKDPPPKSSKRKQESTPVSTRIWQSGTNVLKHIRINSKLMYEATQENFPQRSLKASERIVEEFGKTFDRTTSLIKRVVFWGWGDEGGGKGR